MNPKKWLGRILALALIFSLITGPSSLAAAFPFESQAPSYYAQSQEIQVVFTNKSDKPIPVDRMDSLLFYSASPGVKVTQAQIRNIEFDRSKLVTVNKEACLPSGGTFKVWINYRATGLSDNRNLKNVETQPVPIQAMEKFRTVDGVPAPLKSATSWSSLSISGGIRPRPTRLTRGRPTTSPGGSAGPLAMTPPWPWLRTIPLPRPSSSPGGTTSPTP